MTAVDSPAMTERAYVDIRLLGPVAAFRDGEAGALGGPRQRAVLARLALRRFA